MLTVPSMPPSTGRVTVKASQATVPRSDATFLYARAAVVLGGKPTVDRVLADYNAFAAEPRDMDAEGLLTLPETVMEALDGDIQPPPGLPSYESRSNLEHWPTRA